MKVRKYRASNSGKWTNAYKRRLNRIRTNRKRADKNEALKLYREALQRMKDETVNA